MGHRLEGVIASQVTPFDEKGGVDEDRLRRLIDRQLAARVSGFLIVGNCGEFTSLTDEERVRVVAVAVEQVGKRVPIMAGVFHSSTGQAVALARAYKEVGADAALVVSPYFIRPSIDVGAVGGILAAANLVPETMVEIYREATSGDRGGPATCRTGCFR